MKRIPAITLWHDYNMSGYYNEFIYYPHPDEPDRMTAWPIEIMPEWLDDFVGDTLLPTEDDELIFMESGGGETVFYIESADYDDVDIVYTVDSETLALKTIERINDSDESLSIITLRYGDEVELPETVTAWQGDLRTITLNFLDEDATESYQIPANWNLMLMITVHGVRPISTKPVPSRMNIRETEPITRFMSAKKRNEMVKEEYTMGIFDKLKSTAQQAVNSAAQSLGNKRETFTFTSLPESLAEMQALPEASLDTPFKTAALTVLALCAYAADRNIGTEMLNWLRGPRPLNGQDISFLNDRFRDGKTYLPFTYSPGSTPDNNYTPSEPYTIIIESNHVSSEEQGYIKLLFPVAVRMIPVLSKCASAVPTANGFCGNSIC